MKDENLIAIQFKRLSSSIALTLFLIAGGNVLTFSQESTPTRAVGVPAPLSERFFPIMDLLAPSRDSDCALQGAALANTFCRRKLSWREYEAATSIVRLYNADGTVWHDLEMNPDSPSVYWKLNIPDFEPLVEFIAPRPYAVILRGKGKSPNWYEVEINERTQATKFVLRNDKAWSRTKWDGWLYWDQNIYVSKDHPPLLDAPNGKVVSGAAEVKFKKARFIKADGDWTYVEAVAPTVFEPLPRFGWLRWRSGREILVGCFFNHYKVPEIADPVN